MGVKMDLNHVEWSSGQTTIGEETLWCVYSENMKIMETGVKNRSKFEEIENFMIWKIYSGFHVI